jgi:tetratricopeptide (TPR) repeat protein
MHKRALFISSIYFYLLLVIGCNANNDATRFLQKAQSLAETNPGEALKWIDSISDPENNLNEDQYMEYLVAHTQIYYKSYLPIESDSLIFKAVKYYQQNTEEPKQTALAYFYAGTVLREQKKYGLTMEYYKTAEKYATRSLDSSTIGLINFNMADMLAEQGRYGKALIKYKTAAKNYEDNPEKQAYSFSSAGRMYLFEQAFDSAFYFFDKGLKIAEGTGNKHIKRQLAESLSVAYEQVKKYDESLKHLQYSLSFNTDSTRLPRYHLNFAILYHKMLLRDSTLFYAEKLKKEIRTVNDNYLKASILSFLIDFEKKKNNISAAFDFQTDRMDVIRKIMEEREKQSVYRIEKRYNYEQIEKKYFESLAIKQRWIILLLGMIILGGSLFSFYRAKQKNIQSAIQSKIYTLAQMNNDLESKVQKKHLDLRRELLWRFNITKKFIKINEELNKKGKTNLESGLLLKKFNTIVYGQDSLDEQWETLHQAFREARPGYSEKIKQLYPDISETEFRICILTYADFSVKEIALILQQSPNTIQTRRTSLRKKLGLSNGGDIADSIDRLD